MEHIFKLLSNPVFSSLIGIIGTISTIMSLYTKKKRPLYVCNNKQIISNKNTKYDGLTIMFKDCKIENLNESIIFFWNAGLKAIDKNDIIADNPLRICFPHNSKIYRMSYQRTLNMQKTFKIKKENKNSFIFTFDSMLHNEGICIKILHNISENEINKIRVIGKLKDSKDIQQITFNNYNEPYFFNFFNYFIIIILTILNIAFSWIIFYGFKSKSFDKTSIMLVIVFLPIILITGIYEIKSIIKKLSPNIPKELKRMLYEDNFLTLIENDF